MRNEWFPIRKGGIFRPDKEIKGLRGGVPLYAAQGIPQIDTVRAEKNPFRMETDTRSNENISGSTIPFNVLMTLMQQIASQKISTESKSVSIQLVYLSGKQGDHRHCKPSTETIMHNITVIYDGSD